MKLLILTQKVDRNDPILGFFHRWLEEFAKSYELVTVICLEAGKHELSENVKVLSLGKEEYLHHSHAIRRLVSLCRFYKYIWNEKENYDAVFVHMNQEYVLMAGWLWRLMGKKVYFWRLHPMGSWLTNIACALSHKIFTSSKRAFVSKFEKTVLIPVGVDLEHFRPASLPVESNKILVFGRIAPIKKLEYIIRGLSILSKKKVSFEADIIGDALLEDREYYEFLQKEIRRLRIAKRVKILASVPPDEAPSVYRQYKLFVNVTPDGSLDKTIIEALSSGLKVVVANSHFRGKLPESWVVADPEDPQSLAHHIKMTLDDSHSRNTEAQNRISEFIEEHRLERVIDRLAFEMRNFGDVNDG